MFFFDVRKSNMISTTVIPSTKSITVIPSIKNTTLIPSTSEIRSTISTQF